MTEFCLHGIHATTMGVTPALVVGGRARLDAGLSSQHGALGSAGAANRGNAATGRAVKLALQNVGGALLGGTESTTLGSPSKFSLCVAEWEERADKWEPLHELRVKQARAARRESTSASTSADAVAGVDAGAERGAVTVISAASGPTQISHFTCADAEELLRLFAESLDVAMCRPYGGISDALLVVCPEHYDTLLEGGYDSKAKVQARLFELTDSPSLCDTARALPKFASPQAIHIVVAGAAAGKFSAWLHGFGFGEAGMKSEMSRAVTVPVRALPCSPEDLVVRARAAAAAASKAERENGECDGGAQCTVLLDPTPAATAKAFPRASRVAFDTQKKLATRVALLDIGKPKGRQMLDVVEARFQKMGADVTRYAKPGPSRPAAEHLKRTILGERNEALVVALAD